MTKYTMKSFGLTMRGKIYEMIATDGTVAFKGTRTECIEWKARQNKAPVER
jgi:hypothetical protein